MVRPYSVTTDSKGPVIVTDPGAHGVHIFDFAKEKYKFRRAGTRTRTSWFRRKRAAVDAQDKIYVTDSDSGKKSLSMIKANGKMER